MRLWQVRQNSPQAPGKWSQFSFSSPVFQLLFELAPDFVQAESRDVENGLVVQRAVADHMAPFLHAFLDHIPICRRIVPGLSVGIRLTFLLLPVLPCNQGMLQCKETVNVLVIATCYQWKWCVPC